MARSRFGIAMLIAALAVFGSGCGTMANFDTAGRQKIGKPEPPAPFGGVACDVRWASETMAFDCPALTKATVGMPMCALYMVDVPFSLVCDVVTLPFAMIASAKPVEAVEQTPGRNVLPVSSMSAPSNKTPKSRLRTTSQPDSKSQSQQSDDDTAK